MRATILFLFLALPLSAQAGMSATKAVSGECRESPQEALENLALDIEAAHAKARGWNSKCAEASDPERAARESGELERAVADVQSAIDRRCQGSVCVANVMASLCKARLIPETKCFGGCSDWASEAAGAIGPLQYFAKERVQKCVLPGGPWCHWVVKLTNPRTGEQWVIDAWAKAGGVLTAGDSDKPLLSTNKGYDERYPYPNDSDNFFRPRCALDLYPVNK